MTHPIVITEHYHVFEELNIIVVALKLQNGSVVVGSYEISSTDKSQDYILGKSAAYYDALSRIKKTSVTEEVGDKFNPLINITEYIPVSLSDMG